MSAHWRYVLSREKNDAGEWWSIRELYMEKNGKFSWTEESVEPGGETPEEFATDLAHMLADSAEPCLDLTLDPPALVARDA